jgi:AcrR family transcriptional regulator
MTPAKTAAKPRLDVRREDEILTTAADLLCDVGYDKLTFDLVAQAVKASKATLYRRWPTKADMVIDALTRENVCPLADLSPDTGSLVGDLEVLLCSKSSEMVGRLPRLMAAICAALHRDTDFTERFADQFLRPRQERMAAVLEAAQRRGELGPTADLRTLGAVMPSMAIAHLIETGQPPTDAYMRQVLEHVLLPACAATMTST